MKKLIQIFLILASVFGCSNPFSIRMTADFYPLEVGNRWIYQVEGDIVSQVQSEVTYYDTLYTLNTRGEEIRMKREMGGIYVIRTLKTTYQGDEVLFGRLKEPFLLFPLIDGDSWSYKTELTAIHEGDTVYKNIGIKLDSITQVEEVVPAGTFKNSYRLKRIVTEDEDSLISYEWYAPDVGPIKLYNPSDSITWELEEFVEGGE